MAYPDINAVMENCSVRKTREIVWKAFNNRAVKENSSILEEAVQLRNEKALLFGFKTWAEYIESYDDEYKFSEHPNSYDHKILANNLYEYLNG